MADAAELRERGNSFFREEKYTEAAAAYREALAALRHSELSGDAGRARSDAEASDSPGSLLQAVRLNLATCLLRLKTGLEEAVALCDDVLAESSDNAKALFRRGGVKMALVAQLAPELQRQMALGARADLLEAARLRPSDRQLRQALDEATELLRGLDKSGAASAASGGSGFLLGGAGRGLYCDKVAKPAPPPAPPVICRVCGREGHAECGPSFWNRQRADWLGVSIDAVSAAPPADFECDGELRAVIRAARHKDDGRREDESDSELSTSERENLEDCIEATDRPYPPLKHKIPLKQAVHVAEELWFMSD